MPCGTRSFFGGVSEPGHLRTLVRVGAGFSFCFLWMVLGCASEPRDTGDELTLRDLRSGSRSGGTAEAAVGRPRFPVRVEVGWYDRADAALERSLAMLQPAALDGDKSRAWTANGFRVGTLDLERAAVFLGNLPTPIEGKRYTVRRADIHSALPLHVQPPAESPVRLFEADGSHRTLRLMGGTHQLLCKTSGTGHDAEARVEILPHFYSAVQGASQNDPDKPNVDGISFMSLRIEPLLDARHVWVFSVQPTPASRPGEPVSLAQAMLTRHARNRELQGLVFVILDAEP